MGWTGRNNRITIDYEILTDSPPTEQFSVSNEDANTATVHMKCDWDDRMDLRDQLMGVYERSGLHAVGFDRPQQYPDDETLEVVSVGIVPFGTHRGGSVGTKTSLRLLYDNAELTVRYGRRPWNVEQVEGDFPTVLMSESIEPTMEFAEIPAGKLYWNWASATDPTLNTPIAQAEGISIPFYSIAWNVTIHRWIKPSADVFNLVGSVNNAAIRSNSLGYNFPAESLLYAGSRLERDTTSKGVQAYRVTMAFKLKIWGAAWNKYWNHFLQSGKTEPQRMYVAGPPANTIYYPYPLVSFDYLMLRK